MNPSEKKALTIAMFCQAYSVGRTTAFQEIKDGKLQVVKLGRKNLVTVEAADAWFALLKGGRQ